MGNFLQHVVTDENGDPLEDAIGQIFAVTDTTNSTPLVIYDASGTQYPLDQLTANNDGVTPRFSVPGKIAVKWVSGVHEVGMIAWDIVPTGGTVGQALMKISSTDHDMGWLSPPSLPTGGLDGEVLYKNGTLDYDAYWGPVTAGTGGVTSGEVDTIVGDLITSGTGDTVSAGDLRYKKLGTTPISDLPAGTTLTVRKSGSSWPARPTDRTDVVVIWVGADPDPAIVTSGTAGAYSVDIRMVV